jgi:imidazole glycerol-phosphate synthase subunit HisH
MIHIINYGLGNVQAFANVYKRLGVETRLASRANELENAQRIILPGVGAFDHAVTLLEQSGMRGALNDLVVNRKVPVLGVCVGMQLLANTSDEGNLTGLGWVPGRVRSLASVDRAAALPLPHMGWNDVRPTRASALLRNLETDARFYFLHSFYFEPVDHNHTLAIASYGMDFSCAVGLRNVYGIQCHPEKSHHWGTQLLKNFAEIDQC